MSGTHPITVALLYPGDRAARDRCDPAESRFAALFAAFAEAGVRAEPAVWHDDFAGEVAQQLERVDAVLVWCNPIEGGRRRDGIRDRSTGLQAHQFPHGTVLYRRVSVQSARHEWGRYVPHATR